MFLEKKGDKNQVSSAQIYMDINIGSVWKLCATSLTDHQLVMLKYKIRQDSKRSFNTLSILRFFQIKWLIPSQGRNLPFCALLQQRLLVLAEFCDRPRDMAL